MTGTHKLHTLILAAVTASVATISYGDVATGWNQTASGPYNYSDTANWVGGVINNTWDSSLVLTANQTITFGSDTTITGDMSFSHGGGKNISFASDTVAARNLTLGGNITVMLAGNQYVAFGTSNTTNDVNVNLGATAHTFNVGNGKTLAFYDVVSGSGSITSVGAGQVGFYGANTFSGPISMTAGSVAFVANGRAAASSVTANASTLTFNNTGVTGGAPITRVASATLVGGNISVSGVSGSDTVDIISGAITADRLNNIVTVTPNAAKNAALQADSLNISTGATVLFRGTNLGANSIASKTAGSANIYFSNAPTLVGGSGVAGTSTISVMKAAYGDATAGGNGTGLVTYDATNGVRMLTASEYKTSITDGQSQLDNIKLANSSGAPLTQSINSNTTVGSLSLGVSTASNSGVIVDGAGTLTVASGMLFANQSLASPTSSDAMIIRNSALSFGNTDAYLIAFTNNISNGTTPGPLQIESEIKNAATLTKSGSGVVKFTGSTANTYTGTTYVNAGVLHLSKSISDSSIIGDIVINGGTLFCGTNQIADTSNITLNNGSWVLRSGATNSGSSTTETIHDLTMAGGSISAGGGTTSGSLTVHNANISAGTIGVASSYSFNVQGDLSLSGGLITLGRSTSAVNYTSAANVGQNLSITNTDSGAYTAISFATADATHKGSKLSLGGNLQFTGNASNTNTAIIGNAAGTDPTLMGAVDLTGSTRTFNIGDGAAAVDLAINASLINGGLTKTGAGTLALNGNNTYTGLTTISQGKLAINGIHASNILVSGGTLGGTGSISGAVTVSSGGTLAAGNSVGTLTVNALTLDSGSAAEFEFDFTGNDLIIVSGSDSLILNGGTISLIIANDVTLTGAYHLFQYTGTLGGSLDNLTLANAGYQLVLSSDGTNSYIDVQTSGVPEPAAISLLAAGGTALLMRRRRSL